jgi:hypothetical protein
MPLSGVDCYPRARITEIIGEEERERGTKILAWGYPMHHPWVSISMRPPGKLLGRATCLAVDFVEK